MYWMQNQTTTFEAIHSKADSWLQSGSGCGWGCNVMCLALFFLNVGQSVQGRMCTVRKSAILLIYGTKTVHFTKSWSCDFAMMYSEIKYVHTTNVTLAHITCINQLNVGPFRSLSKFQLQSHNIIGIEFHVTLCSVRKHGLWPYIICLHNHRYSGMLHWFTQQNLIWCKHIYIKNWFVCVQTFVCSI